MLYFLYIILTSVKKAQILGAFCWDLYRRASLDLFMAWKACSVHKLYKSRSQEYIFFNLTVLLTDWDV